MNFQEFNRLDLEDRLKATVCSVECTPYEQLSLWKHWSNDKAESPFSSRVEWEEVLSGWLPTVGKLADRPVCISVNWAFIEHQPVLFWHATSIVVDYDMIDNWLKTYMPQVYVDQRQFTTDAQNFHIVIHTIRQLNKEGK